MPLWPVLRLYGLLFLTSDMASRAVGATYGAASSGKRTGNGLAVQVKPHADCFAFFVGELGVGREAGFCVEGQDAFIMLDVRVHREEPGGEVAVVAVPGYLTGFRGLLKTSVFRSLPMKNVIPVRNYKAL
jgi:hypothetical protein